MSYSYGTRSLLDAYQERLAQDLIEGIDPNNTDRNAIRAIVSKAWRHVASRESVFGMTDDEIARRRTALSRYFAIDDTLGPLLAVLSEKQIPGIGEQTLKVAYELAKTKCDHLEQLGMRSWMDWIWQRDEIIRARVRTANDRELAFQRPMLFVPGLRASAFWDPTEFEWTETLRAAAPTITEELAGLRGKAEFQPYVAIEAVAAGRPELGWTRSRDADHYSDWNVCALNGLGPLRKRFVELCPKTSEIVRSIPRINWLAQNQFSALGPKTFIDPHYGPTNTALRVHLCLVGNPDCYWRVGNHIRRFEEGKVIVFDDSYEHTACNEGSSTRITLMLTVMHPDVPQHLDPKQPEVADTDSVADVEMRQRLGGGWWT
jgi:hypothetical protein